MSELGLCWATHPKQPNRSGTARGRAIHLRLGSSKISLCNMKFDARVDMVNKMYGPPSGKYCRSCNLKTGDKKLPKGWQGYP